MEEVVYPEPRCQSFPPDGWTRENRQPLMETQLKAEKHGEKYTAFSPSTISCQDLPLMESNGKPVGKGTWKIHVSVLCDTWQVRVSVGNPLQSK